MEETQNPTETAVDTTTTATKPVTAKQRREEVFQELDEEASNLRQSDVKKRKKDKKKKKKKKKKNKTAETEDDHVHYDHHGHSHSHGAPKKKKSGPSKYNWSAIVMLVLMVLPAAVPMFFMVG